MTPTCAVVVAVLSSFAAKGHELSVVVEDSAGKPLPGVAVWMSAGSRQNGSTPAVARGTTDQRGTLVMPIPPEVPRPGPSMEMLSVWAYQPGASPGRIHVTLSSDSQREELRLTLPPAQARRLTLLRPDGKPLQRATVKPSAIGPSNETILRYYLSFPDELANQLALRTDQDGNVDVPYLGENDSPMLTVDTVDLGIQLIQLQPKNDKPFTLRPVGKVVGRVVADELAIARGIEITLGTQFDGKDSAGSARTKTDAEGRFVVPALAEGSMSYMVALPPGSSYRAVQESLSQNVANRDNHLEIHLKRAVRVRGVVQERGTNRPIPAVGVMTGGQYQFHVAYTDVKGRFEDDVLPGQIGLVVFPWLSPRPFFPVAREPRNIDIPANVKELMLPAIELARGDTVTGKVVDSSDRPVPGARVEGTLIMQQGNEGTRITTSTGTDGAFLFPSLDPTRMGLKLEASTPVARTEKPLNVSPALHTPVILTIHSQNLVSLSGRVVSRYGRPVEGAELEVWSQDFEYAEPTRLSVSESVLRTGPDGRYQTPRGFRVDHRYRVKAGGPGLSTDWSDWTRFQPGKGAAFPDLVIDRPRLITGQVIDTSGRPVAGAELLLVSDDPARPHSRSHPDGSFRIDLPARGTITILADARGFRFQGQVVKPTADAVKLVLARSSEPAAGNLNGPAQTIPAAESLRMALKVLDPDIQRARTGPCGVAEYHTLQLLARLDPTRAMEIAEKTKFAEPMMRDGVKAYAARGMLKETPDEAMALIESLADPIGRTDGYRQASDALPASERDKKLTLLNQGLVHAQGIKDPALRLLFLGQIAGRLHELGERERATKILRDGQTAAKELSTSALAGFGRGAFAEDLARIDVSAALELVQGLTDEQEFDRHHGNLAQRLALSQPAEAERVWKMIKKPIMRDGHAVRVCFAMAPSDLPRARRIAGKISDPYTQAYTLGQMALAASQRDKAAANQLVAEALGSLAAIASQKKESYVNTVCAASTAATLLEVVERVNPQRVREVLWRSLALRGPRIETEREEIGRLGTDAVIAMLVLPYDRSIAQALVEPIFARLPRLIAGGVGYIPDPLFAAPAIVDPQRAIALIEGLPTEPDLSPRRGWTYQRQLVSRLLASRGDDRRHLVQQMTGFWRPDAYDLVDDD
jgi:Carboxypeptidase regulatory-like domain